MKLKLLCIAVLISASVVGQSVPSYVPTNGLVGWWPFNGNANDDSGNGNNGTVNGATLTTDRFGNSNSAYTFDGLNDFIEYPSMISNSPAATFSFYSFFDSNISGNVIGFWGTCGGCTQANLGFLISINGNTGINVNNNAGSTGDNLNFNSSLLGWHHIVITIDNISLTAYVDGQPLNSSLINILPGIGSPQWYYFGRFRGDNNINGYFHGILDDIGIWNRALTQQEITALYQTQQPQCLPTYVPTNGLVGWYPFCGNANDESGNGNNGTVNGATLTSDRFGNGNGAYSFDGINDFINYGNVLSTSGFPISISGFLKLPAQYQSGTGPYAFMLFSSDESSGFYSGTWFALGQNLVEISFGENGARNSKIATHSIAGNTWVQLAAVVRGQNDMDLYINGSNVGGTYSGSAQSIIDNGYPATSGYYNTNSGVDTYQEGILDDIGIWNRALTQQEITALYLAQNCNGGNTITPDGPTTFCAGNSVKMTSSAIGATYQWQRNGVNISGATTRRYKAVQGGSYTCVATCNGTPVTSNTIQLTWLENKPVTLSAAGSIAFCVGDSVTLNVTNPGANYSIQWYRTNISLPGQTGTSLVVTQPGTYKVVTRNNLNGCSRISSSGITTTSNCRMADREVSEGVSEDEELSSARVLDNENSQGVKIYPNPNQGRFRFEYRGHESGSATLQVINSMGQQLHEQRVEVVDGLLNTDIQLDGHFTSGIYIVRMVLNGGIHDSRVVVE